MKQNEKEQNKPVAQFKDYPVSASVWKKTIQTKDKNNKAKNIIVYNVTLQTSYKDDNDEYKTSSNFKPLDLLKAKQLCDKAYNYIVEAQKADYEEQYEY